MGCSFFGMNGLKSNRSLLLRLNVFALFYSKDSVLDFKGEVFRDFSGLGILVNID